MQARSSGSKENKTQAGSGTAGGYAGDTTIVAELAIGSTGVIKFYHPGKDGSTWTRMCALFTGKTAENFLAITVQEFKLGNKDVLDVLLQPTRYIAFLRNKFSYLAKVPFLKQVLLGCSTQASGRAQCRTWVTAFEAA